MGLFTRTQPRRTAGFSLVAASKRLESDDAKYERSGEAYGLQLRSLAYNESVGEVWYASKFYERSMRQVRLIVQAYNPTKGSWAKSEDPAANELLRQLVDPNGEASELLGKYGRLQFLNGDARLFGELEDGGTISWEMLSVQELRVNAEGQYVRKRSPNAPDELIDAAPNDVFSPTAAGAVMFRLWTPSARFSEVSDWPLRACLDICEELLLLTRKVRGEIRSRLAGNGILGIPDSLLLAFTENGPRADEDPKASGFMQALTEAMETAIQNDNAASALMPIIVTGPDESINKMIHLSFAKPMGDDEAKRSECIRRLAGSLDMPPEALLGISDTNHWGAWQIDESSWKVHIEPVCRTLVENLTSSWFRPILRNANYRIWYDESELVNHPDRSKDFETANEKYVVSNEAYRKAIGAQETDAMPPEEQDRMAQLKALAHRGSDATVTPSATSTTGPASAPTGPPASTSPQGAPADASSPPTPIGAQQAAKLIAAAEIAVWRGRELAGSRLRSKVDRAEYRDVPNIHLAYSSRANTLFDANPDALVAGAGTMLAHMLEVWDVPREVGDAIVQAVETHARDTLFESSPMPMPDELVALCSLGSLDGTHA